NNFADGWGGGLYVATSAQDKPARAVTVQNTVFYDNSANSQGGGVGLAIEAPALIENSRITANYGAGGGGGLYVLGTYVSGKVSVRGSEISGNSAYNYGAGIHAHPDSGRVEIDNSTIAYNTALYGDGGGVFSSEPNGLLLLRNSTVAYNFAFEDAGGSYGYGGGLAVSDNDGILLQNSSVAYNYAEDSGDDVFGYRFFSTNSAILDTSSATIQGPVIGGDQGLFYGADFGGATFTFAHNGTGNLTDNGDAGLCTAVGGKDQRGVLRNVDARGDGEKHCDIGAYEFNGRAIPCPDSMQMCGTTFPKGSLSILDNPGGSSDSLKLSMTGGTTSSTSVFGNPARLFGTANAVCIYNDMGELVQSLNIPAGHPDNNGVLKWKLATTGVTSFAFAGGNADGVSAMSQKPSTPTAMTSGAINASAMGVRFTVPFPDSDTVFIDGPTVTAQNRLSNGECFQVSWTAAQITSNVLGKFTAVK
ncbi:MAG: right-handed parallel beta-helix repeat-containing protein, partial [Nevskiales bacterium]